THRMEREPRTRDALAITRVRRDHDVVSARREGAPDREVGMQIAERSDGGEDDTRHDYFRRMRSPRTGSPRSTGAPFETYSTNCTGRPSASNGAGPFCR